MRCSALPLPTSRGSRCRATAPGNKPECDFGLTKSRGLDRNPDRAGHRRLATAAECEAVDGRNHRLAKIFNQVEHVLPETAGLLGLECRELRQLADVGARDECLVAGAGQNGAPHFDIVARSLESGPQVTPCRRAQGV